MIIDTSVRTGKDYGITASVSNIQQLVGVQEGQVTIWGDPGDPAHDFQRGWSCLFEEHYGYSPELLEEGLPGCAKGVGGVAGAVLSLPSTCAGPGGLTTTANADTWPDQVVEPQLEVGYTPGEGLGGCNRLSFEPSIEVAPDGQAGTPLRG